MTHLKGRVLLRRWMARRRTRWTGRLSFRSKMKMCHATDGQVGGTTKQTTWKSSGIPNRMHGTRRRPKVSARTRPPSSAGRPLVGANATAAAATKNKTTTLMDNETLMECGMNAIRFDMSFKTRSAEIPLQTRGPFHSKQDKNVALHLCLVVTAAGWPRHGYF